MIFKRNNLANFYSNYSHKFNPFRLILCRVKNKFKYNKNNYLM